MFKNVSREPTLVEKVASELTEAIVAGDLRPGSRLLPERELGEQFGVSRTVVREAVRSLAARGLVTVTSGRGVEVVGVGADAVTDSFRLFIRGTGSFDYEQVHELRSAVEIATAGLAAARSTPVEVQTLTDICTEHDRLLDAGDFRGASKADFEFHRVLAAASGNQLFVIVLDSVGDILQEVRDHMYPQPGIGQNGLREHRDILRCVGDSDEEAARQSMTRHLAQARALWATDRGASAGSAHQTRGTGSGYSSKTGGPR